MKTNALCMLQLLIEHYLEKLKDDCLKDNEQSKIQKVINELAKCRDILNKI